METFKFEQVVELIHDPPLRDLPPWFRTVDERFQRLVLPTIVTGKWPRLDMIELRGIKSSEGEGELAKALRDVLGENATIAVEEQPHCFYSDQKPSRWS